MRLLLLIGSARWKTGERGAVAVPHLQPSNRQRLLVAMESIMGRVTRRALTAVVGYHTHAMGLTVASAAVMIAAAANKRMGGPSARLF